MGRAARGPIVADFKKCNCCGEERPISRYAVAARGDSRDGVAQRCRDCTNSQARARTRGLVWTKPLVLAGNRLCRKCDVVKPRTEFYRKSGMRDGLSGWCKPCTVASVKPAPYSRYPEAKRAHQRVVRAIRQGVLVKPLFCSKCESSGRRIEAHHEDYSRPLDVEWLCGLCHGATRSRKAS